MASPQEPSEPEAQHQAKPEAKGSVADGTKPPKRPRVPLPAPVKTVNTSGHVWREEKAAEVPHDSPTYFPSDLWPRTNVILLEAQRKFPRQTEPQTLELCKYVTSEMTPLFCEAVKAGKMKAGDVQREEGGGMEDLLHLLLVRNDPGPRSGWGLSGQAYRLGEKVRESDEWLKLAKAIAEVQSNSTATDLRSKPNNQNGPTSQPADQNLRDAIHKKKARIVEIDRTLDRPQEEASRLRLAEERELLVTEVEELKAYLREVLVDRAIASRKRMLESFDMPEGALRANAPALDAQKSRALLGIELARLAHLRRGVWKKFFDEARISDVVKTEWQSVLSMRKVPDWGVDLGLTFGLTKEYEKAISRASAQLADLLATAAGSRINQAQLREAIWRECLDFAYQLGQWDAFATWVHRAVHIGWQTLDTDGQPSLTPDRECEKRLEERRKFFEGRIGMYSQEWLSAIDEAIELRRTVSAANTVNASGEIEERTLGMASAKAEAAAKEQHAETQALSLKLQRGKRCAEIVEEMKRFRYLRLDSGRTVTEIQTDCSDFLIWKLRENLSEEDRDLFDHPNRWESVVTYVYGLLGKEYAKSWTTIRDWVKVWNRSQRTRK